MTIQQKSHPKYPIRKDVFLREDALSFYLLGVFLSDGHIGKVSQVKNSFYRIGLTSADEDWLKAIRDTISPNRPLWKRRDQRVSRLEFTNQDIAQWLISWCCLERKSLSVIFPEAVPTEYLADCVRGVFDGDGSLTVCPYRKVKNGRSYTYWRANAYICSGSERFITGLAKRLQGVNFQPSVFEVLSKGNLITGSSQIPREVKPGKTWRLQFSDRTALPFLNWMYYERNPLAMPRKANLVKQANALFAEKRPNTI